MRDIIQKKETKEEAILIEKFHVDQIFLIWESAWDGSISIQ